MGLGPRAARHGPDRSPRRVGVGALLGLVLALAADASQSAQPPPSPPAPPPASGGEASTTRTAAAPIPIERIAPAAAQAAARLRTLSAELAPSAELDSIRGSLERMQSDLKAALERTRKLLQGDPSLEEIQAGNEIWSRREVLLGNWLDIATAQATGLQKGISELESLRETWSATQRVAAAGDYPALLKHQIDDTIAALDAMLPALRAKRDAALDAQARSGKGSRAASRLAPSSARPSRGRSGASWPETVARSGTRGFGPRGSRGSPCGRPRWPRAIRRTSASTCRTRAAGCRPIWRSSRSP